MMNFSQDAPFTIASTKNNSHPNPLPILCILFESPLDNPHIRPYNTNI